MTMNFTGKVVNVPTNGSILVCEVKEWNNAKFYVSPTGYDNNSLPFFLPAWTVPVSSSKKDASELELVLRHLTDLFHFQWPHGGSYKKVEAAIKVHFLTLPGNVDAHKKMGGCIQLSRPVIPHQVVVDVPVPTKPSRSAKAKQTAGKVAGMPKTPTEFAWAKHMLR